MVEKAREQKKMAQKEFPWDPAIQSNICLKALKEDIELCNGVGAIAHTGCVYGNAEAAFYENMLNEGEMVSLKEKAANLRHDFSSKCKCMYI